MSVRERRPLRHPSAKRVQSRDIPASSKDHVVYSHSNNSHATIIMHSPHFSINNTYISEEDKYFNDTIASQRQSNHACAPPKPPPSTKQRSTVSPYRIIVPQLPLKDISPCSTLLSKINGVMQQKTQCLEQQKDNLAHLEGYKQKYSFRKNSIKKQQIQAPIYVNFFQQLRSQQQQNYSTSQQTTNNSLSSDVKLFKIPTTNKYSSHATPPNLLESLPAHINSQKIHSLQIEETIQSNRETSVGIRLNQTSYKRSCEIIDKNQQLLNIYGKRKPHYTNQQNSSHMIQERKSCKSTGRHGSQSHRTSSETASTFQYVKSPVSSTSTCLGGSQRHSIQRPFRSISNERDRNGGCTGPVYRFSQRSSHSLSSSTKRTSIIESTSLFRQQIQTLDHQPVLYPLVSQPPSVQSRKSPLHKDIRPPSTSSNNQNDQLLQKQFQQQQRLKLYRNSQETQVPRSEWEFSSQQIAQEVPFGQSNRSHSQQFSILQKQLVPLSFTQQKETQNVAPQHEKHQQMLTLNESSDILSSATSPVSATDMFVREFVRQEKDDLSMSNSQLRFTSFVTSEGKANQLSHINQRKPSPSEQPQLDLPRLNNTSEKSLNRQIDAKSASNPTNYNSMSSWSSAGIRVRQSDFEEDSPEYIEPIEEQIEVHRRSTGVQNTGEFCCDAYAVVPPPPKHSSGFRREASRNSEGRRQFLREQLISFSFNDPTKFLKAEAPIEELKDVVQDTHLPIKSIKNNNIQQQIQKFCESPRISTANAKPKDMLSLLQTILPERETKKHTAQRNDLLSRATLRDENQSKTENNHHNQQVRELKKTLQNRQYDKNTIVNQSDSFLSCSESRAESCANINPVDDCSEQEERSEASVAGTSRDLNEAENKNLAISFQFDDAMKATLNNYFH